MPDLQSITVNIARTQSSPSFSISDPVLAEEVRKILADNIKRGCDVSTIKQALTSVIDQEDVLDDIVYTEPTYSYQAGILTLGLETGAKSKVWESLHVCCSECAELDGAQVSIGMKFTANDKIGHPPLHSRCRCATFVIY